MANGTGRGERDPAEDVAALALDLRRLHATVVHWSPTRWAARTADGRTRDEVVFALVVDLAELGRRAGSGAPADARVPQLGAHALADQLVVLGSELVAAPDAHAVVARARDALEAARRLLLG
jgi:hypothetical protein